MSSTSKPPKPASGHCPVCGTDTDAAEQKLLADIAKYGWHAIGVTEDEHGPAFVYSIGLYRTWQHPEIVVFGLDQHAMHRMISNVVHEIKTGKRFRDGDESTEIVEGYSVAFRRVHQSQYRDHFGYALWYYNEFDFPVLQCVWPDRAGSYPWNSEYLDALRRRQAALWEAVA